MYIDVSDLGMTEAVLAQLTDDDSTGSKNDDIITAAIEDAQAVVDGYCGKRYMVPFTDPTRLVKKLTAMLAKYNLYARRDEITESVDALHKDAIKTLSDISTGKVSLGIEPEPAPAAETGGTISGPKKVFGRDNLKGF